MTVTCYSVAEFVECLVAESELFQNTIRISIIRRRLNEAVLEVVFQASAVVEVVDSQYLLEVGIDCGKDYSDGEGEHNGSHKANNFKHDLICYAETRGWKILPGVISQVVISLE